jgi:hypothetical protein
MCNKFWVCKPQGKNPVKKICISGTEMFKIWFPEIFDRHMQLSDIMQASQDDHSNLFKTFCGCLSIKTAIVFLYFITKSVGSVSSRLQKCLPSSERRT